MGTCTVDDCERPVFVEMHGLCQMHYARWRRYGDPSIVKRRHGRSRCSVEGCEQFVASGGLCSTHLKRLQRWGTTDDPPPRPTTCPVDGCGRQIASQGFCERHYRRTRRDGEPEMPTYCRQCQQPVARATKGPRVFCSDQCRRVWEYWDRLEGGAREVLLQRKYNLSLDDYRQLFDSQGGACAICGTTDPTGHGVNLHVDHCHETGRIRGLLCNNCNNGLGRFKDDPARLRAAADYVERCQLEV